MFSDVLSWINFWGWQLVMVSVVVTFLMGINTSKRVCRTRMANRYYDCRCLDYFGINMFGTIAKRRVRHLYVAIWFYIGTWVVLRCYVFNNLEVPLSFAGWKSYSAYTGVKDALVQWWVWSQCSSIFLDNANFGINVLLFTKSCG